MIIRGTTRLLGIFGDPVAHSLSPLMQNAALAACGIDAVYAPFRVPAQELAPAVAAVRALNFWGVNVTVPHKEAVCAHLDRLDPLAARIGAVNTIVHHDGVLEGFNTDAAGFLGALREDLQFDPAGKRILLLGAGGACRAAVAALGSAGAAWIGIANRHPERGAELVRNFRPTMPGTSLASLNLEAAHLQDLFPQIDLLVNTTSVGLCGETFAGMPWPFLNPAAAVFDMVYGPEETPLVRAAREGGHRAADGVGMLAAQGEEAFRLWTGTAPPPGLMKSRLLQELGRGSA